MYIHTKKGLFINLLILCLGLCILSCSAEDGQDIINKKEKTHKYTRHFYLLVIGNSLSRDAFSYAPSVIEDVSPETYVDMQILYIGGKALNDHIDYLSNDVRFTHDKYDSYSGRWSTTSSIGEEVLFSRNWNMVILQEGSGKAKTYENTIPDIHQLATYIHSRLPLTKLAYMINPSYSTSDIVWEMYASTARQLLENNEVDYIIPCGTGIQNTHHTIVDKYGDYGHLSYDGRHLQEGLPCLIEAYVAAQTIFSIYGIDKSINNCNIRTTQEWVDSKRIPGKHGSAIDGSPEEYEICKKCALQAVASPFEISMP